MDLGKGQLVYTVLLIVLLSCSAVVVVVVAAERQKWGILLRFVNLLFVASRGCSVRRSCG